ncbi:efflux RND transporter periplasmic adaptor subunit [Marivita sp. GX14005]|uniref:efflux RND transporter periplasmic adaptor subunit n=1 Tax=Marivita sp. GX14005 TaxID=2942276 RepID=UPI0020184ABE|nr:efflux RND transporter periplasmic adaptor subunit [Marivita sp. GX14005]MCL3881680.1 efflux RND transporter periplasmic adaptor subunit [Marivita sp. GX14005]
MIGRMSVMALLPFLVLPANPVQADTITVEPVELSEWKSVYGTVETRDRVPARARIGGTIDTLNVTEGDRVNADQQIALVEDDKFEFQLASLDAQLEAARARLDTARTELERGRTLLDRGIITTQRMDQLRTDVDVIAGQIRSLEAERLVLEQRVSEGAVLSPQEGIVLSVPVTRGSVVNPGEVIAEIGGGGVFLRLSLPERHAEALSEGDEIIIGSADDGQQSGTLVKLYPQIDGGRVLADVEVAGLDPRFVGRRLPVRLPIGIRPALLVPEDALTTQGGLDYVTVETAEGIVDRVVVPGAGIERDERMWREILTGLTTGDRVVTPDE